MVTVTWVPVLAVNALASASAPALSLPTEAKVTVPPPPPALPWPLGAAGVLEQAAATSTRAVVAARAGNGRWASRVGIWGSPSLERVGVGRTGRAETGRSALEAAGEPLDHGALQQEVDEKDRRDADDQAGEDEVPLRDVLPDEAVDRDRDGHLTAAAQVEQRGEEVVPDEDHVEDHHG